MKWFNLSIIIILLMGVNKIDGAEITRNDIIETANSYVTINNWRTTKDSIILESTGKWESFYEKNTTQSRMPYSFGCFNTPSNFNMSMNKCPGGIGTEDIYNTLQAAGLTIRDSIAGIDCAGFVLRCWGVNYYTGYTQRYEYGIKIEPHLARKGDWIVESHHQLLCDSLLEYDPGRKIGKFNLYESTARKNPGNNYPGVQCNKGKLVKNFQVYSPFPQFSSPKPGNGYIVHLDDPNVTEYDIDIELIIRASGDVDNTKTVSGTLVSGMLVENNNMKKYNIKTETNIIRRKR